MSIEMDPARAFVRMRHVRFTDVASASDAIRQITEAREWDGDQVEFLDGTWFGHDEVFLTLGSWADAAPYTSDYTGQNVYYQSIQHRAEDYLTVHDYLWRWDTDWFWCSRAFGA